MNNVVVFIAPTVNDAARQKLAESLRIHQIAITNNIQKATLIIADTEPPVERMDIAVFAEKIIDKKLQEVLKMKHEFILLNQKPKDAKSELNMQHTLKQFNQTKKICNQRNFNRKKCK